MYELLKDYQQIEPKFFKAFMAAAKTQNFTSAAQKAHMTQSGVSQHIAKLEEQIGLPLFKRIGKRVILTQTGQKLVKYINDQTYSTDFFLDTIRGDHDNLSGLVSYAMPPSCILSPHFPMLLDRKVNYPDLTLNVTLAPSHKVVEMVLDDKVDFGFITHTIDHPLLHLQIFCEEEYIMVCRDKEVIENFNLDNILEHKFVLYPGADVYFNIWLKYHCNNVTTPSLPVCGHINSIDGAILMVEGGMGLSVFPRHCIADSLEKKILYKYQGDLPPLLNKIFIVKVADHTYPLRVEKILDWYMKM